jgi:hypothetical protein
MTAGNGFAANNQRQLVFGLGQAESIDEIRIRWPGGAEETFHGIPCDEEVLFVEGAGRRFVLPGPNDAPEQIAGAHPCAGRSHAIHAATGRRGPERHTEG